ncbi:MAG TPA: glycosyltransferase [Candidatus Acidoferrum sp.]|nr:glycosyltransferase [Candidatus Acidoferrum sp.]
MNSPFTYFKELFPLFFKPSDISLGQVPIPDANTVVIYPPTINWNWMKQRPQQMMEQFARYGYPVYYCNMTQKKDCLSAQLDKNLTLIHNNSSFIKESIPLLKAHGKKILVWCSWSKLYPLISGYRPDFVIYDYLDDFPAWQPYLHGMVETANMVVTTAQVLQAHIEEGYPGKPVCLAPNGCALERFQGGGECPVPAEFQEHTGPVILFSGAWADWVDAELVEETARAFPEAMVAIVGAEFNATVNKSVPNIRYIGHRPYDVLPAYFCHSTVCIIPFKINTVTLAANPIKVYEYLAAGKPVVSTDLPEVRNIPGVQIGTTHAQFLEQVEQALKGVTVFPREEVGAWLENQTWERRFEEVQKKLLEFGIDK